MLYHTLEQWVKASGIPPDTLIKIRGTLAWMDKASLGMLPSRFWFSNVDVHRVLRFYHRSVSIWSQPPGPEWSDWLVLDCSTDVSGIASRATYAQLLDYFRPSRLHGALTGAHYSPWRSGRTEYSTP